MIWSPYDWNSTKERKRKKEKREKKKKDFKASSHSLHSSKATLHRQLHRAKSLLIPPQTQRPNSTSTRLLTGASTSRACTRGRTVNLIPACVHAKFHPSISAPQSICKPRYWALKA
mmetsp:Transcript_46434/g.74674  ORF Transcript_46434/g.74674 Transcript_46434/m.74674 type:complete len:116 (+) Transcript_46434:546-893(+)